MVHDFECIENQFSWKEVLEIWKNFIPPIRPSIEEQEIYKEYIRKMKNRKKSNVLILGVTPELRKLVSEYFLNVIAIDFHTIMIKTMNQITKDLGYSNFNEVIIKGDWFSMPFRENKFDLILGDCSLNSIRNEEITEFFKELERLLKINGYICMRIMTIPDELKKFRILDIFKMNRMKNQKNSEKIFEDLYLHILCSIDAYDSNTRRSSISKARKEWRKLYSNNMITKQEFEAFESILSKGEYSPLILKRTELEDLINNHFNLVSIKNICSKSIDYSPIYCLKSKY
jgi:ubiquinone/menaquinone biosynthesis C-methylase UbiE